MAFFTEFLPMSEECTTFNCADVSAEDVAYAKSFWQSIQLNPPVESTLTTQKVTQRVKTNKSNASTHNTAITANAAPSVKVGRACINQSSTPNRIVQFLKTRPDTRLPQSRAGGQGP